MSSDLTISEEYIETLCERLHKWSHKKGSWIFPQFLEENGIGWTYFQAIMEMSPKVHLTFEVVLSRLCSKWVSFAFKEQKMSQHMQKLLMDYISLYDGHSFKSKKEARQESKQDFQIGVSDYNLQEFSEKQSDEVHEELTKKITKK